MTPRGQARLPGRQIAPGERPTLSARQRDDLTFLVGSVISVDEEKLVVAVELFDNLGVLQNVSIAQPFAGTSSFIMGMPEEGSLVVIGFEGNNKSYIVSYLPNYSNGLENRNVKKWPDSVFTQDQNEFFYRVKKLLRGQIALGSSSGIELFLGDYFQLDDRIGNRLVLRSDEGAIINTACNNSFFSSGVWLNTGLIKRNSIDFSDIEDIPHVYRENYLNGRYGYVLRPGGSDSAVDPYYTEYLLEVEDKSYKDQPENDMNGDSNRTVRKPIAIFGMGNLVGNNPASNSYGRILRPVLFNDADDDIGDFSLDPVPSGDIDTYGTAIALFKPERSNSETGTFFGFDKEGHVYQYIPASTGGGLGKGRSMSILARGSKKEVWGMDSRYGSSWELRNLGGIVWNIGAHNERTGNPYSNRSIDVRTSSSVFYMYGSQVKPEVKDFDKSSEDVSNPRDYFKVEKVGGKERHETDSNRETIVRGLDKIRIEGARVEQIVGANTTSIGSNMNIIVGDAFTEKVSKEKQETFGNRTTTITSGSSKLIVQSIQGNITEEITKVGSKTVKVKVGNISDQVITGNRTIRVRAGNIEAQTNAGNLSLKTRSGNISLQTRLGSAEMKCTLNMTLRTNPVSNVDVQGGSINLKGKTRILGGVITTKTHKDYITGAPLVGSKSVNATL
jgi:hypothetical protein